jgi:phage host-nuclease inhibitor protein Gam
MTDDEAPTELDVRLEWPHLETPAVTKRPLRKAPEARREAHPKPEQGLVPQRRPSGVAEDMLSQINALTRMMSKLSATDIDQLSSRVAELATAVGDQHTGAQARRTSADVKALTKRIDSLTRTVEVLPSGVVLAELFGRVDTLARTVETLCKQVGAGGGRAGAIRDEVAGTLEPLHDATAEVRRLTDTVSNSIASRSDRQAELVSQISALAGEVRELRRSLPMQKAVVKKKPSAKKAAAKKAAPQKKASARKARAPKRSGRAASAQT